MAKARDTVANLEEKLTKSEEGHSLSRIEATKSNQTLTRMEQMHAKLVSEHATLQATLTSSENQNSSLHHELKSALEKVSHLQEQKEGLARTLESVENRLKVVRKSCELKETELDNYRQKASSLEKEKNELSLNLKKLQESCRLRGRVDAAKLSECQSQVSELQSTKSSLQDKVSFFETTLKTSQQQCSDLGSKLTASSQQVASLTSQLNHTGCLHKDLQTKYVKLLGVLEVTLGLTPVEDSEEPVPGLTFPARAELTKSPSPVKVKDRSLDSSSHFSTSLAESGVGTSFASPHLQSSLGGTHGFDSLCRAKSPSKLSEMKLDAESIRDAILQLQKRLIAAERSKEEALSSATTLEKKIQLMEEEKH